MDRPFRIVVIEPLPDWIRELYSQQLPSGPFQLHWSDDEEVSEFLENVGGADALVTAKRRVTSDVVRKAGPSLKLVQVQGRAPWSVDLEAAREAGVPVAFMPHRGAIAVAEQAMALMLGLYRKLVAGHQRTVGGDFRGLGLEPVETTERKIAFNWLGLDDVRQLYGKVLGVVGLGDVGQEVVRRARAFDMSILYHKRDPIPEEFEKLMGIRRASLEELLEESDIVSLHAPHSAETEKMINADALSLMKRTAVLINTSRGGVVDEEALAECLREGHIAGAGLDVFSYEPVPADHPFLRLDNVLLSPHVGGGTGGGQRGMVADVIENISRVASGHSPLHLVE